MIRRQKPPPPMEVLFPPSQYQNADIVLPPNRVPKIGETNPRIPGVRNLNLLNGGDGNLVEVTGPSLLKMENVLGQDADGVLTWQAQPSRDQGTDTAPRIEGQGGLLMLPFAGRWRVNINAAYYSPLPSPNLPVLLFENVHESFMAQMLQSPAPTEIFPSGVTSFASTATPLLLKKPGRCIRLLVENDGANTTFVTIGAISASGQGYRIRAGESRDFERELVYGATVSAFAAVSTSLFVTASFL